VSDAPAGAPATPRPVAASAPSVLGAAVRHDRPTVPLAPPAPASDRPVFVGVALIVVVVALKIVLRNRLARRHAVSLDLVVVSIGFLLLLMMRLPVGRHPGWIGTALFVGMAAVYKLLGYFEEPAEKD
jgi:hypothetical protein